MSDGGAAEGWGDRDGSISPEAKPLLRVRGWSSSVWLAGWQKGFSVWWQSGRQPQRDHLIPHEEQNCGFIPLRFTHQPPCAAFHFLIHLFLISTQSLTTPPRLSPFLLAFHFSDLAAIVSSTWPRWHLAWVKSYLFSIGGDTILSVCNFEGGTNHVSGSVLQTQTNQIGKRSAAFFG